MKELIFVRHAKSDWGNEYLKDVDRFLSERGYSDAYFLSEWYLKNKKSPDLILASTATRALNTALIFARTLEFNMAHFKLEERIYESKVDKLKSLIREQNRGSSSLMIFGHNPTITNICNELSVDMDFENIPTCGIVSFNFDIADWADLRPDTGKLNYYQFPKNFKIQD